MDIYKFALGGFYLNMAYTTISGDTWDMIAKKVYGSEYHADILMEATGNISARFNLTPGLF